MYFNKPYNRQEFLTVFQTKICPNFVKQERPLQVNRKTAYFVDNNVYRLGTVELDQEISVLEIQQKSSKDPRITLTKDAFKILYDNGIDNALVIFYSPDNTSYRLSLLTTKYVDWDNKKTSSYKRYSYILGPGEKTKTPKKQLLNPIKDYDDLISRFDVEVVRKDFFEKYLELFVRLYKDIKKDNDFTDLLLSQKVDIVSFTKNLLGKIVFLYFIQQKGWLGLGHKEKEYGKGNKNFMRVMWDNFSKSNESMSTEKTGYFYNDYLERLFFAGLNVDRRDNDDWFPNLQMKVPYLNGGLFKEDYLGREKYVTKISNDVFSNVDTKGDDADGILDVFDRYNFTIDEDSLYDSDIAVDPEMLGRIFEKMISISSENIDEVVELYNNKGKKKLDFGKELNKKLGAFYTPREIVHYMTKESLIAYLVNNIKGDKEENEDLIRDLFELKEQFLLHQEDLKKVGFGENTLDNLSEIIDQIDEALKKVKILDPAVGSGAFPMGLLHEISSIRYYMYGVFHSVFGDKTKEYKNKENKISMYQIKREIILNNIYGVDIDPGAIDIARLRFWLSLVVDEDQPEPLPNFEFKFVCANTLIPLEEEAKEKDLFAQGDEPKLETLKKYKRDYYNANTNKEKKELKDKIREYTKVDTTLFSEPTPRAKQMAEFGSNFDNSKHSHSFFDPSLMMSEWRGFDIVIGNPPYIKEYDNKNAFSGIKGRKYYMGKMDIRYYFSCYGLDLLKDGGIESFIAQNNWITSHGAKIMRNKILEDAKIKEFIDFGDYKVFQNVGIQTMIYILEKSKDNKKYKTRYSRLNNVDLKDITTFLYDHNQTKDYQKHLSKIDKVSYLDKTLDFVNDEKDAILGKIYNSGNFKLTDKEVIQGIVGAPDDYYLIDNLSFFSSEEKSNIKKFYSNVGKYSSGKSSQSIIYIKDNKLDLENTYPNIFKHFEKNIDFLTKNRINLGTPTKKYFNLHRERDDNFFKQGSKIICGTRVTNPSFYYTDDEYYGSRALNFIKTDRINLKYLTAILNSNLSYFWLKNKGKLLGNLLQVDKSHLLNIPLKEIPFEEQKSLIDLVDQILVKKKNDCEADTSDLEKEIDQMVYELYGLTEEEIKVVEESVK